MQTRAATDRVLAAPALVARAAAAHRLDGDARPARDSLDAVAERVDASGDSWPGVMPGAKKPLPKRCRSLPQMPHASTATRTSPGPGSGIGTRAISISPRPRTQAARISGGIAAGRLPAGNASAARSTSPANRPMNLRALRAGSRPHDRDLRLDCLRPAGLDRVAAPVAHGRLHGRGGGNLGGGRSAAAVRERSGRPLDCAARQLPRHLRAAARVRCGRRASRAAALVASRAAGVRDRRVAAARHLLVPVLGQRRLVRRLLRPPAAPRSDLLREHGLRVGADGRRVAVPGEDGDAPVEGEPRADAGAGRRHGGATHCELHPHRRDPQRTGPDPGADRLRRAADPLRGDRVGPRALSPDRARRRARTGRGRRAGRRSRGSRGGREPRCARPHAHARPARQPLAPLLDAARDSLGRGRRGEQLPAAQQRRGGGLGGAARRSQRSPPLGAAPATRGAPRSAGLSHRRHRPRGEQPARLHPRESLAAREARARTLGPARRGAALAVRALAARRRAWSWSATRRKVSSASRRW